MHTLHEFFGATNGVAYLIACMFLIVFPAFWIFLSTKKKSVKHNVKKDLH